MTELIPAVAYLRMSSDQQDQSIEQQRREILAFAERQGYRIVGEYIDEGLSGSKEPEKRIAWQRLLIDATSRQWSAVLCWNSARFSRLDSIDGAFAKQILRDNGIVLDTVTEGKFDFGSFDGRLKDVFLAEQNNAYSKTLGKESLRGRRESVANGYWPNSEIPYGFDRLYTNGHQELLQARTAKSSKPKKWHLKLTPNEQESETVRWIFEQFVNRHQSLTGRLENGLPLWFGEALC